jgi:hypothetical protein
MPSKVEVDPSRRLEKFSGKVCLHWVIALLDRQLASHRHQPELGRASLHLTVGTTDDELFERIIVSLPVALVAGQLLQERPSGMAIVRLGRSHHGVGQRGASCRWWSRML